MKIATITYHRARNYGSVLQTYALSTYLRSLDNDVQTIDFYSINQENMYQRYEPVHNLMSIVRNIHTLLYHEQIAIKERRFNQFIEEYIPLTTYKGNEHSGLYKLAGEFDLFICGSDQIWNTNCGDFDPAYLLDFVHNKSICCSYAPSIGVSSLNADAEELFIKYLTYFKYISVREKTGATYLESVVHRKIDTVLDPVFLLSENEWKKISCETHVKGKFVLGYYIGDISGMRKYGEELGNKTGYKVVVILKNLRDVYGRNTKIYDAGPQEFLWLIEHAEYVCTNSFHAVAFSVIFKKKFWVFVDRDQDSRDKPQSRIVDIADMLGLSDRIIDERICQDVIYDAEINWENVYSKLSTEIEASKQYLNKCLNKGE